ncbi:MAG: glycosyltransferase [Candidatus Eisenbacteria bacterium]|uniref:Glycosyltransferase n=1 Tax=Eiseniibacteriota bacterium TaxID=2212470 RepID=A0A538T4V6_UNCEI|nr:MAG: glycosyltransferase [Candidatus Eisenbacteria bacterium]
MTGPFFTTAGIVVAALYWLEAGVSAVLGNRCTPGLGSVEPLPDERLPSLSIIATAKDEAEGVEQAARSLLAQDYPHVRTIIADDRSTDATGRILDRLAAEEPRLHVLHVGSLPEGWIGKCHALALGAEASDSDWILFTDADVTLAPEAARRAVSLAVRGGWDHVAVGPDMRIEGLGEAVFIAAFVVIFNASLRPWLASDPRRRNAIGIGAFNLVHRDAYRRAGGHAKIRYELLDDIALGKMLKESGARQVFARHDGLVAVRWHEGVSGLVRGVEKNAFPAARYNVLLGLVAPWVQLALGWAPLIGLFLPGPSPKIAALAAWAGVFLCYREAGRNVNIRIWQAILMPVGVTLFLYSFVRSMMVTLKQGGVLWRGTFYSLPELRRRMIR